MDYAADQRQEVVHHVDGHVHRHAAIEAEKIAKEQGGIGLQVGCRLWNLGMDGYTAGDDGRG